MQVPFLATKHRFILILCIFLYCSLKDWFLSFNCTPFVFLFSFIFIFCLFFRYWSPYQWVYFAVFFIYHYIHSPEIQTTSISVFTTICNYLQHSAFPLYQHLQHFGAVWSRFWEFIVFCFSTGTTYRKWSVKSLASFGQILSLSCCFCVIPYLPSWAQSTKSLREEHICITFIFLMYF